jgi:hypothetical protein
MQLPRSIGLVDLGVLTIVFVMVVLPPRQMYASAAQKGDDRAQFALALAEARTIAYPQDGNHVADLARRLGEAQFKDWAVEAAIDGAARAHASPTAWKALLAASVAYVDKLDVIPALDYANRALVECQARREGCPTWEEVRMRLYQQHLDAGVASGIDPRRDPAGFRAAGEGALRSIRLNTREGEQGAPAPGGSGAIGVPSP